MGYLHNLKVPSHIVINYKGKKSNFTVEEPGRHHLNQVIEVNFSNGTNQNRAPPHWMQWKELYITSVIFLPKTHSLNQSLRSIRQTQTERHSTTYLVCSFRGDKVRRGWETVLYWSRGKKSDNLMRHVIQTPGSFCCKEHHWDSWSLSGIWRPRGSYVSVLVCWFDWLYGGYVDVLLCRKYKCTGRVCGHHVGNLFSSCQGKRQLRILYLPLFCKAEVTAK